MDAIYQNRKFTDLRFEYYVSGRMLWFNDTMGIAAMLLGYAVELSLKHILIASGMTHKKQLYSHKHLELFLKCEEVGAIPRGQISVDLLQYVSDMFHQRYPSQALQTSTAATERGHGIGQSFDLILAYDDLIIQLDDILSSKCSDTSVSIGLRAAHVVAGVQGRYFFHCNVAALKNSLPYLRLLEQEYEESLEQMKADGLTQETIAYNLANHRQTLTTWREAPASIWRYEKLSTCMFPDFDTLQSAEYARDFEYPGRVIKGNGITVHTQRGLL